MRIRWRNLELPTRVVVDRATLTDTYGMFTIDPFERGFGHTIGNGLRRVLLSSIEGTAPTWMTLRSALHEFQPVDGLVEDVTDIVLQVKRLRVRLNGAGPVRLKARKNDKGPMTAGDFMIEGDAEIVNPELVVCTLHKKMDLELEIEVARGRGYVTAEENEMGGGRHSDPRSQNPSKEVDQEIGKVWLDSTFSPVLRVKYAIQDTRVGKITDYDRLVIEIWTDGSIRPEEALTEASKIYRKCLNPLVAYGSPGSEIAAGDPVAAPIGGGGGGGGAGPTDLMSTPLSELNLSVRSGNCLQAENIETIGDLLEKSEDELMQLRNFGRTSLNEVKEKLAEIGLTLKGGDGSPDVPGDEEDEEPVNPETTATA
jgi:DNA-directed RNA polymerase subunit alpha